MAASACVRAPGSASLAGTFTLSLGNTTTAPLDVGASAADVCAALLRLPNVGGAAVARAETPSGAAWRMTLAGCRSLVLAGPTAEAPGVDVAYVEVCSGGAPPLLVLVAHGVTSGAAPSPGARAEAAPGSRPRRGLSAPSPRASSSSSSSSSSAAAAGPLSSSPVAREAAAPGSSRALRSATAD